MNEKVFFCKIQAQTPPITPSFLCLSILPRAAALRALVVFGAYPLRAFKLFKKKGKHG
jgi:hypothetical protein